MQMYYREYNKNMMCLFGYTCKQKWRIKEIICGSELRSLRGIQGVTTLGL